MSYRQLNLWGVFGTIIAMSFALYLQYGQGLEPCPLCIFQRMAMISLGLLFALAALHAPQAKVKRTIYGALQLLAASAGIVVAGRHVWLQNLPADQVPACGPGYDYLMQNFPMFDAMSIIFRGSGECAKVDWMLFGLSLPTWTLLTFISFALFCLFIALRRA